MSRWLARLLVVAAFVATVRAPADSAPVELTARTRTGGSFALSSLRGRVVVLDFWAPWCVPCSASFPFLDRLREKYAAESLAVVGLTLEESKEAIDAFLEAVPVRFPVVSDPTGRAGEALGVVAMPTTFLLDREGRVAGRFEGGDPKVHARIDAAVAELLAGRAIGSGDVRVPSSVQATGRVKAWQRGYLADPLMQLDGDPLTRILREHIFSSKEAAAGDGGASGGGCGCN